MKTIFHKRHWLLFIAVAFLFAGCAAKESPQELALIGEYVDDYDTTHTVSWDKWQQTSSYGESEFNILSYDNEVMYLVAQNAATNAYNPDLFSRFDWAVVEGGTYYCQTAYDAATAEDAAAVEAADATNPAVSGCGQFAWTKLHDLADVPEIAGVYGDNWGSTTHTILPGSWTQSFPDDADGNPVDPLVFTVKQFNNEAKYLIAQNGASNAYNPSLFSRFDWTEVEGTLYYCQTAYAAITEDVALATPAANATDPATSGCGDFSWTKLTRK